MGYLWAKDEGNQFFKHVPHFCDFTRSSGTFSLNKVMYLITISQICLYVSYSSNLNSIYTSSYTENAVQKRGCTASRAISISRITETSRTKYWVKFRHKLHKILIAQNFKSVSKFWNSIPQKCFYLKSVSPVRIC